MARSGKVAVKQETAFPCAKGIDGYKIPPLYPKLGSAKTTCAAIRYGLVVRIPVSHTGGPGSIPGNGTYFALYIFFKFDVEKVYEMIIKVNIRKFKV